MFHIFFFIMYKMNECNSVELTYYQRNREVTLNIAKDYYENEKERLREQEINTETYLKKKKNKKREYGKNRYQNMYEEKIKRLKEYQNWSRGYNNE